jgi:hypothetical protein
MAGTRALLVAVGSRGGQRRRRSRTADPASLKQLRRVCQLLTSRTVRDCESRRAFRRLVAGCTKHQASAMLDYFIPVVRAREATKWPVRSAARTRLIRKPAPELRRGQLGIRNEGRKRFSGATAFDRTRSCAAPPFEAQAAATFKV